MSLMHSEYKSRLEHWQRVLAKDFYTPLAPIPFEGFCTMEHLSLDAAAHGPFAPMPEGTEWGHTWEYMWMRSTVTVPAEAANQPLVMSLDMGGEATLFVNGKAFGTRRADWVSVPHHYISDNVLAEHAVPGEKYDLLFEVYAGHYYPDEGGCATGPVLPGTLGDPKQEGRRARVGHSTIGLWNEDAYQLWLDVSTLQMLLDELPEDSLRASKIADGLELYTRIVDFEQPAEVRNESYRKAREALKPLMEAHNGTTAAEMWAIGNAHLDLAWLWPQRRDPPQDRPHLRGAASPAGALPGVSLSAKPARGLRDVPRSTTRSCSPAFKAAARGGRWIAEGAMYVEPDTNMPSGEALVRQLVLRQAAIIKDELGVDSRVLWLPDTFGYSAALPQLLKGCGVDYLVTQKIFWSYNEGDPLPLPLLHVEGHGRKLRDLLPAHQLHLPHRPQGAVRRLARAGCRSAHLDDFLHSLWLRRRRRRPLPGLHRVCPAGARLGGNAQGEDGLPPRSSSRTWSARAAR